MTYMPADGSMAYQPKAATPNEDDDDDVMIIGIDFGTTYSGVAWATVADFASEQINLITSWPGTGREEGKAPTELFYEDDQIFWGYEIPDDADPVRWFKLLLVKDEDLNEDTRSSEFVLRGRKMLKETGKTAIGLIADYLRLLWRHILETVKKARGEYVVDALRFHVVITGMEEAARQAGIMDSRPAGETKLSFAPEPEAAAFSTLCEPGRRTQPGDVYLICDAGGGTVDLISYKISSVNPISMEEAVEVTGGLCGGIFIDEAFERACKSRLGRRWDHLSKAGIKEILRGEWEHAIKPQFNPQNSKKEYTVSIPAEAFGKNSLDDLSREPFIKKGRIHFSSSHIQEAFTESFAGIDKLIDGQIKQANSQGLTVKGIILVGGLGASPYLYEHLKDRHSRGGITILQSGGMRPRTAICNGAVYKGFLTGATEGANGQTQIAYGIESPITVKSTISRTSIGFIYHAPFDPAKHLEADKAWYPNEGEYRANNQINWYLKRGDNVSTTHPVRHNFYRLHEKDFGGLFEVELFESEEHVPPSRVDKTLVNHSDILTWITATPPSKD
ncbi:Hsp70 family protein [Aspergillus undulatus]|uniref:Hsp70 family protein n=1 Tax=Aspergillus undulatus TaxID=1810928 RepID=UPI003CCC9BE2